jgi:hypothetical protein
MSGQPGEYKCLHRRSGIRSWIVKLTWRGKTYWRNFADRDWGGEAGALEAALAWRDKTERRVGKPRTERHVKSPRPWSRLVGGVSRLMLKGALAGYRVSWSETPGDERRTDFRIPEEQRGDTLVEADYYQRACEFRKDTERRGYGLELDTSRGCKKP